MRRLIAIAVAAWIAVLLTSALASAAAIGLVYGLVIVRFWGGNFASLIAPEATLFSVMFVVFGAVFGTGFYLAYVRRV